MVELNSEVIDPKKHSAVVFKEIEVLNIVKPNRGVNSTGRGKRISNSKRMRSGLKGGIGRSSGTISKIIQRSSGHFKNSGDRNTKFFHKRTLKIRKQNWIMAPKNEASERIFYGEGLRHEAIGFFNNLYGENLGLIRGLLTSSLTQLEDSEIQLLRKFVSNEEKKTNMFDMGLLKASGSDSIHAFFFRVSGNILGFSL
ncbi:hypothetical protein J1N35_035440 [Gossypium stocksii]|uniref:Uncharacterized protein n=1 Tax=Gossypium stocksii TaxID=47602 RepID=A0A9D3UTZ3_9ROSI|nr:hypothetical protein J1N35_035440 [Gossypium stocksii]